MTDDAIPVEGAGGSATVTLNSTGANAANSAAMRVTLRRPGVWVGFAVVAALAYALSRWADLGPWRSLFTVVGLVAFAGWMLSRASMRAIRTVYPKRTPVGAEAGPSGLTLRTPEGSWHADWAEFSRAEQFGRHLVLFRAGRGSPIVLVPALVGPDTIAALEAAGIPVTAAGD